MFSLHVTILLCVHGFIMMSTLFELFKNFAPQIFCFKSYLNLRENYSALVLKFS